MSQSWLCASIGDLFILHMLVVCLPARGWSDSRQLYSLSCSGTATEWNLLKLLQYKQIREVCSVAPASLPPRQIVQSSKSWGRTRWGNQWWWCRLVSTVSSGWIPKCFFGCSLSWAVNCPGPLDFLAAKERFFRQTRHCIVSGLGARVSCALQKEPMGGLGSHLWCCEILKLLSGAWWQEYAMVL